MSKLWHCPCGYSYGEGRSACVKCGLVKPEPATPQTTVQVVIKMTDDLFVHRTIVAESGTRLPQHAHVYDHLSLISAGAVRVWAGSERHGR